MAPPNNGAVPHEIRGTIWLLLLRLRSEDLLAEDPAAFAKSARDAVADDNSREQIEKDVQRTRPGLSRFKQPAVRGALLRLLSLFCARRRVAYVQGFNELLAPFVLLADTGGNPRIVYALFSEFVTRFAPWMLETSEFRVFDVLKRLFKYFGRLLLYHDPELYWLLERHMMTPDLYATSWFVTLFARNFTVESIMALWDLLLLEDDPLGTSFFGIALLRSKRDQLLSVDESRIPETLMMLTANSPQDVRRLWKIGSEMRVKHTPPSFQRLMTDRILNANSKSTPIALSAARAMQASVCLQTTPDDLVSAGAHYFTWDCRTESEFRAGHLAQAAHLPLDALRDANGKITSETSESARQELQKAVDLCEPLKNSSHICLVGSGVKEEDNLDINMLALYLTRIGIPYVSTLRGGFAEVLKSWNGSESFSAIELVDYDRRRHQEARKERIALHKQKERQVQARQRASLRAQKSPEGSPKVPSVENVAVKPDAPSSLPTVTSSVQAASNLFSSFSDAEVGKAFRKALSGIGLNTTPATTPAKRTESNGGSSWRNHPTPVSDGSQDASKAVPAETLVSLTSSIGTSGTATPSKKLSTGISKIAGSSSDSNYNSTSFPVTPISSGSGEQPTKTTTTRRSRFDSNSIPTEQKSYNISRSKPNTEPNSKTTASPLSVSLGSSFFASAKSPWGREAKPGWLDDHTLTYALSSLPKHFTVNVMDESTMSGLRLFPCKAKSDRGASSRSQPAEFKKRYVGVSRNYFLLLAPHSHRSHLLEVVLIRYLQDISRITFKRSRPEVVTFEIATGLDEDPSTESLVCLMPDGLTECVALIKNYIDDDEAESESNVSHNEEVSREQLHDRRKTLSNGSKQEQPLQLNNPGYKLKESAGLPESTPTRVSHSSSLDGDDDIEFGEFQTAPSSS